MGAFDQLWASLQASPAADAVRQVQMHGGVLPSIYSAADSFKRRLKDAAANPGGYLAQTLGELQDHPEAIASGFMPDGGGAMQGGLAGTFASLGSRLAPEGAAEALQRLNKGHDPAQVWRETGWGMGPDSKMRFEIPDNKSKFNSAADIEAANTAEANRIQQMQQQATALFNQRKVQPDLFPKELNAGITGLRNQAKAAEAARQDVGGLNANPKYQGNVAPIAYEHPDLYDHYPALASTFIQQGGDLSAGALGRQLGDEVGVSKYGLANNPRSVVAHELQHNVQDIEGFSPGGNPQMFRGLDAPGNADLVDLIGNGQPSPRSGTYALYRNGLDELRWRMANPERAYQHLAGEAEARLTQARLNMTPEERLAQYPWDPDYFKAATGVDVDNMIHLPPAQTSGGAPQEDVAPGAGALTQTLSGP